MSATICPSADVHASGIGYSPECVNPVHARVLVRGLAFKENCPDLRNTRVVDIVHALQGCNARVDVFDPWVDAAEAQHEYGLTPIEAPEQGAPVVVVGAGHARDALALPPVGEGQAEAALVGADPVRDAFSFIARAQIRIKASLFESSL